MVSPLHTRTLMQDQRAVSDLFLSGCAMLLPFKVIDDPCAFAVTYITLVSFIPELVASDCLDFIELALATAHVFSVLAVC